MPSSSSSKFYRANRKVAGHGDTLRKRHKALRLSDNILSRKSLIMREVQAIICLFCLTALKTVQNFEWYTVGIKVASEIRHLGTIFDRDNWLDS
jgi:hypothetical protein